jgi:hypothetical protein
MAMKSLFRGMPSSEMVRRMALLRTDVSEERIAYIIRVTRIGELGKTLAVTSKTAQHTILHRHRRENLQSYITLTGWGL